VDVEFIKKLNEKNQKTTRKALSKIVKKNEKQNFRALLTMQQVKKVEKHYDVYVIAAKIARGESISSDELKYIREHAPGLLADARIQFGEKLRRESEEKNIAANQSESVEKTEASEKNDVVKCGEMKL